MGAGVGWVAEAIGLVCPSLLLGGMRRIAFDMTCFYQPMNLNQFGNYISILGEVACYSGPHHCLPLQGSAVQI